MWQADKVYTKRVENYLKTKSDNILNYKQAVSRALKQVTLLFQKNLRKEG